MPNIKSAAKRLKTSEKQRIRNKIRKTKCKNTEKKFFVAVEANDVETAKVAMAEAFKAFDKAAKKGTIHQNRANRKKAQFAAKLKSLA